ncbi:type II secretion system protein GspM [Pseudomonas sp. SBB6]|uniref:type II secretion system protein GspM n=1 Tax=Pseudomonas sp. SBB6 TaxID=2962032 RepID=UPI0020B6D999|nr:type II secretion system protein GspM [Pseudomonas sp. SBB6]MCP3749753.1 type II secretion system protein GspM [Pseudomonas sp. SBB6]
MNEWIQRRWLLPAAWATVALLLLTLVMREGTARWQAAQQWQALARSAASVQVAARFSVEQLQQSAQANSIVLNEVLAEHHSWQIKGRAADEQSLQRWLLAVQGEGLRPLRWSLEQVESAMTFELELQQ